MKKADYAPWVKGLLAAIISSIASGAVVVIVDPVMFNDWEKLAKISGALGVWGAAMYLKQSPVPGDGK